MGSFEGAVSDNDPTQTHLPFKLMKVETQFLIKNGIARTVEAPPRFKMLQSPVAKDTYEALRKERISKQVKSCTLMLNFSEMSPIDFSLKNSRSGNEHLLRL